MSIVQKMRGVAAATLSTTVTALGAMGLAVLGPVAGTARADVRCDPVCHGTWCPGDPVYSQVQDLAKTWDTNVCHEFHQISVLDGGGYREGPLPPGTFVCPPFAFMCP